MTGRPTLFACVICGSPEMFVLTDELFGCRTLVTLCGKHGPHWIARSEETARKEKAPEATP